MMDFEICGIGWVGARGMGSSRGDEAFDLGRGPLPRLRSRMFLDEPHKRFGRFDPYAKAGFGAIALALRSAGLDRWRRKRPVALIVGTRRGCLQADIAYFETAAFEGGAMASPNLFAYTVPNCMLGEASIQFGLTGPSFVIDDPSNERLGGICAALDVMQWGWCEAAVAGWCDVGSKGLDAGEEGPCGAVFCVLDRTATQTRWRWDRPQLTCDGEPVGDIMQLVQTFLTTRH